MTLQEPFALNPGEDVAMALASSWPDRPALPGTLADREPRPIPGRENVHFLQL